jgi:hypothetical protein
MSEPQLIRSDEARCYGDGSAKCQRCARRVQLDRDDPARWYPQMQVAPVRGACVYEIPIPKGPGPTGSAR